MSHYSKWPERANCSRENVSISHLMFKPYMCSSSVEKGITGALHLSIFHETIMSLLTMEKLEQTNQSRLKAG